MAVVSQLDPSVLAVGLFFIGLYGAMTQRNIIKTIMSVGIMDTGAIVFIMLSNKPDQALPPIYGVAPDQMADPVPQALMITAIVIGVSVIAMCLAMYMRVAYRYRTTDWRILVNRLEK